MARRPNFIATCVVVLDCTDLERCRLSERLLHQRGYESRSVEERGATCVRSLEREFDKGGLDELLEKACQDVESSIAPNVPAWKAFVQIVGRQSAWATLEAGEPTIRGVLPHESSR